MGRNDARYEYKVLQKQQQNHVKFQIRKLNEKKQLKKQLHIAQQSMAKKQKNKTNACKTTPEISENARHCLKVRKKHKSKHQSISLEQKVLIFLAISIILIPLVNASTNKPVSKTNNPGDRNTDETNMDGLISSMSSLFSNNETESNVLNPYANHGKSVEPVGHINHCDWLMAIDQFSGKQSRKKICVRQLSKPDNENIDKAANDAVTALRQNRPNNFLNHLLAWPENMRNQLEKRIVKIINNKHPELYPRFNQMINIANQLRNTAVIPVKYVDSLLTTEFYKIQRNPLHLEPLFDGATYSSTLTIFMQLADINLEYVVLSNTYNLIYYELQQEVLNAVESNNVRAIKKLIALGVEFPVLANTVINSGQYSSFLSEVKPVLQTSIDFLARHFSVLSLAAKEGHVDVFKFILENRPADILDEQIVNQFYIAAMNEHVNVMQLLVNSGFVTKSEILEYALLLVAPYFKKEQTMRYLLNNVFISKDNNLLSINDVIPAVFAAFEGGTYENMQILLEHFPHCIREYATKSKVSLLHVVVRSGDRRAIEILLNNDPGLIKITDSTGMTAAMLARKLGDHALVQYFNNLDQSEKSKHWTFAVLIGIENISVYILKLIIIIAPIIILILWLVRKLQERKDSNNDINNVLLKLNHFTQNIFAHKWQYQNNVFVVVLNFTNSDKLNIKVSPGLSSFIGLPVRAESVIQAIVGILHGIYPGIKIIQTHNELMVVIPDTKKFCCWDEIAYRQKLIVKLFPQVSRREDDKIYAGLQEEKTIVSEKCTIRDILIEDIFALHRRIGDKFKLAEQQLLQLMPEKETASQFLHHENETVRRFADQVETRCHSIEEKLKGLNKSYTFYTDILEKLNTTNRSIDGKLVFKPCDLATLDAFTNQLREMYEDLLSINTALVNDIQSYFAQFNKTVTSLHRALSKQQPDAGVVVFPNSNSKSGHKFHKDKKDRSPSGSAIWKEKEDKSPSGSEIRKEKNDKSPKGSAIMRAKEKEKEKEDKSPTGSIIKKINENEGRPRLGDISEIPVELVPACKSEDDTDRENNSQNFLPEVILNGPVDFCVTPKLSPYSQLLFFAKPNKSSRTNSPSHKKHNKPSKLSKDKLKQAIKNYAEAISELVSSVEKYSFDVLVEKIIYSNALSYYMLRMFHGLWLYHGDDPAEALIENPNHARLMRHMLIHIDSKEGYEIIFNTAFDVRENFIKKLLEGDKQPNSSENVNQLSKEKVHILAAHCNFDSTELYQTLKPKWDAQEQHVLTELNCQAEIIYTIDFISRIMKSMKSAIELQDQDDRYAAIKKLIANVGEYAVLLRDDHEESWKDLEQKGLTQLLIECIDIRSRVCHFIHPTKSDIYPDEAFKCCLKLIDMVPTLRNTQLQRDIRSGRVSLN